MLCFCFLLKQNLIGFAGDLVTLLVIWERTREVQKPSVTSQRATYHTCVFYTHTLMFLLHEVTSKLQTHATSITCHIYC